MEVFTVCSIFMQYGSTVREASMLLSSMRQHDVDMLLQGTCSDTLARKFLRDVGLDYLHGIGLWLKVHEGRMGVSWRVYPDDPGLQEGMFLSNGKRQTDPASRT
jgi:hypothetical protein